MATRSNRTFALISNFRRCICRLFCTSKYAPLKSYVALSWVLFIAVAASNDDSSIKEAVTFQSGATVTTQLFHLPVHSEGAINEDARIILRHHLTCFHRGNGKAPSLQSYSPDLPKGRDKCCYEFYMSGLLDRDLKQYCLDFIAPVPNIPDFVDVSRIGTKPGFQTSKNQHVTPVFYLAYDEVDPPKHRVAMKNITLEGGSGVKSLLEKHFYQTRQLKVIDPYNERERFRDPLHFRNGVRGVSASSPFHLMGFMDWLKYDSKENAMGGSGDGSDDMTPKLLPMRGSAKGVLSESGGMHRSFWHKLDLLMDVPSIDSTTSIKFAINSTVLLPLMDGVFIDADDPVIVSYDGSAGEGISCKLSLPDSDAIPFQITDSQCKIDFLSAETIDIEQPSFASRQYVGAFHIHAIVDLSTIRVHEMIDMCANVDEKECMHFSTLQLYIEYGTNLHIRYPPPIIVNSGQNNIMIEPVNGMSPVMIQHPILYCSSAKSLRLLNSSVTSTDSNIEFEEFYILQIKETSSSLQIENNEFSTLTPPEPIVIYVAGGLDSDFWWVTATAMSAALLGGFALMRSIDSVSDWC